APGSGRRQRPTRPSTGTTTQELREHDPHRLAPVGGLRALAPGTVPHPRRHPARTGHGAPPAQRPRSEHPARRARPPLGRAAARGHRVLPGREGPVLRTGRRQALPAPDVLRDPRGGAAPVTTTPAEDTTARTAAALALGDDALVL